MGVLLYCLFDFMILFVLKLKIFLEQRGVSYEGVVEKLEFSEFVDIIGKYKYSYLREGEGVYFREKYKR